MQTTKIRRIGGWIARWLGGILTFLAIVATIWGLWPQEDRLRVFCWLNLSGSCLSPTTLTSLRSPISNPTGKIITPTTRTINLDVKVDVAIAGTYSSDLEDEALWILVYRDGKYWPQTKSGCEDKKPYVIEKSGGIWNTDAYFAEPGTQFDVVLTVASESADQFFIKYVVDGCAGAGFTGIAAPDLPDGLTELDSITVRTR